MLTFAYSKIMSMRWFIFLSFIPLLFSCKNQSNNNNESNSKNIITVSIRPQKHLIETIAGDKFNIAVLVPDGSGPETYEPTAKQMTDISKSSICFITGLLDFEKSWIPKVADIYPGLKIVDLSHGLDLIEGDANVEHDHDHEHHGHAHAHGGTDPHIWLSIKLIRKQAELVLKTLNQVDSQNSAFYTANFEGYIAKLDSMDAYIQNMVSGAGDLTFMIYHPSLSYYSRDYDVKQIAIEFEGKEPSAAYMRELIEEAKKNNIKTIFYSQQFDKRSAETIAKQLGISMEPFNPLAENAEENLVEFTKKIIQLR